LHDLLLQREELLYDVTAESNNVKAVEYQISIQKKLLLESIGSMQSKMNIKKATIEKKALEYENSFLEIPTQELEYARMQRIFTINEKFYTMLLQKKTEYSISKAGYVPNNVILQAATVPTSPISPN